MGGCGSGKQAINGFAFDTVRLSFVDVRQDNSLQGSLFDPATYRGIVDTKKTRNFRDH